jgi:hypothetical protein
MLRSGPEEVLLILSAALFWRISSNCQKKIGLNWRPHKEKYEIQETKFQNWRQWKKCEDKHGGRWIWAMTSVPFVGLRMRGARPWRQVRTSRSRSQPRSLRFVYNSSETEIDCQRKRYKIDPVIFNGFFFIIIYFYVFNLQALFIIYDVF